MPGRPRWGWHQLDRRWAARLVALAEIAPGDLVVDVGAGTGAITEHLVHAGARVVAVELHPDRVALLRRRFADQAVTVVRADATDLRLPSRPFSVVANPPFGATTALLRRLTGPRSRLERAVLVLPAWAVARWAAGRGAGRSGGRPRFELVAGPRVPSHAFQPASPSAARVLVVTRVHHR